MCKQTTVNDGKFTRKLISIVPVSSEWHILHHFIYLRKVDCDNLSDDSLLTGDRKAKHKADER